MMMNLFSVFDPSTSMSFSLNWISSIYILYFLPLMYWFIPSRWNMMIYLLLNFLMNEFKVLMVKKNNLMNLLIYISMFFFIMLNNLMGMFSYIFTSTSHLLVSLSMALPLWLSFMIFGWLNYTNHMFIHLVPSGTPGVLMPFMVLIETISNVIRPGTLAVRLAANMIAGHLLMTLISSTGSSLSMLLLMLMLVGQMMLIVLELSVAIIQAYVFSVLSTLYSTESN
uniref:ATP synthase F0 subunit 6 n=1 Tax=Eurytoma acutibialis TaxID=3102739 RepID=UPI002E773D21|nr:ATP synthase F0 subunit 6 [Eurytoma acutibialis]WPS67068.1 ATP synthase F0 subunit 6 [Eurytoma acutibialis]